MKLINLALDPGNQARFAATIGYGPVNPESFKLGILTKQQMDWLPTSPQNIGVQGWVDPTWSASRQNQDAMLRFSKFLQTQ